MKLSDLFGGGAAGSAANYWYGEGSFGTVTITSGPTVLYGIQLGLKSGTNLTTGSFYQIFNGTNLAMTKTLEYLLRDNGCSWFPAGGILFNSGIRIQAVSAATVGVTVAYKQV